MRRGRVILTHSSSPTERRPPSLDLSDQNGNHQQPEQPSPPSRQPASIGRGRGGRILSQMASLNLGRSGDQLVAKRESSPPSSPTMPAESQESIGTLRPGSGSRRGSDASSSSVLSQQFMKVETKPKTILPKVRSTAGRQVELSLNYMTFDIKDGTGIEQYHVDFKPNIESIKLRYKILRSEEAQATIGTVMNWTGTNLYLPHKLRSKITEFETQHPAAEQKVKVKITFIKTPPDEELLCFYNSLMHKIMNSLKFVIINRQHYSPMHRIALEQHKLEVWPGWITAIQRLDDGLKLSVDASFRVVRLETVRDIMMEVRERNRANFKENLEAALVGTVVMTNYKHRAYRIDEIDLTKSPKDTFILRETGQPISYIDYMKQHWKVEVKDPHQPMIVNRPKPKRGQEEPEVILLIPELCFTTGLTEQMRSNFRIMKDIGDQTRLPPEIRERKLTEFLEQLSTDEKARKIFNDWNLTVKPCLDVVSGQRLDTETVLFGDSRSIKAPDNVDWTRPATSGSVFKSVDVSNWVVIYTERDQNIATDFLETMREVARILNIKFSAPRQVKLSNDSPKAYIDAGKSEVKLTDQMVVLLTPGKAQREDRYSACKRLFSCEIPVPCQFIRSGNISMPGKMRSIVQKIVIQICAKCGGQPWAMKFPIKSFMIVGIDAYHDTINRKRSCVGFVASMNEYASSWWSQAFFQAELEEIGQKINLTMINALRKFHSLNGFVPAKIIVYRDGVGDGQLEAVTQVEVAQVLESIKFYMRDNQNNEPTPQLSYLIVQKRINTKMSLRTNGKTVNPLPGTFLDHTITHPEYNDFYLVSQHVNQGTVSPTHYILLNESGTLKLEHHQKLAYKMTYMYYNWCGTIRVPAPCQYAHKLAYLTGQNIKQPANARLEDKLYYL